MRGSKVLPVILQNTCSTAIDFINAKPAILKACEKTGRRAEFYEIGAPDIPQLSLKGLRAVLVLGYSEEFLRSVLTELSRQKVHPIVLGADPDAVACSSLTFDRKKSVFSVIDYFRQNGRTKTALFGINANASSDLQRVAAFTEKLGNRAESDVFYNRGSIRQAAEEFLEQAERFDSVVCANDMAAAILILEALKKGIRIPDDLFVCGSGNTHLAQRTAPTLTSVSLDYSEVGKMAVHLYDFISQMPEHSCVRFAADGVIHVRESTGMRPVMPQAPDAEPAAAPRIRFNFVNDRDVVALDRINRALSKCDPIDLAILEKSRAGLSRAEIAFELYIGESTLRYRMDKICRAADCKDSTEFFSLLKQYNIQIKE